MNVIGVIFVLNEPPTISGNFIHTLTYVRIMDTSKRFLCLKCKLLFVVHSLYGSVTEMVMYI